MFSCKYITFIVILLHFFDMTKSLVELPPFEENEIVQTEAIIRRTFNSLFHHLKLRTIKEDTKLKEYSNVYRYFTSLVIQDFENLNLIARLVRVNYKNINKTKDLIEIINNWFSVDQFAETIENDVNDNAGSVTAYILYFLKVLKKFKEDSGVDRVHININTKILDLLKDGIRKPTNNSINFNEYIILNEDDFWEPSGRRIYKGKRTKIKHFPFMASIQIFNNFHCSGSIIQSDLIITASSCLQLAWNNRLFRENPAFLSVRIGSSFYNGGGEVLPVLEIYFHPDYNPKNLKNNICVLRLDRHLNFRKKNKKVKKIDIDRKPFSLPVTTPGITILGWGAKEHSPVISNPWKNILSLTVLDIYPLEDCQDLYSKEYVTKKNFCGGFLSKGGGACNRDVGGPGIADGKLMGVISFGSPVCGAPDAPTVFTKLGYYNDWIEEIMEMDVPVTKKRTTLKPFFDPFTAPPSYTSIKTTTYKIPPLTGGKMTPIPISLIDNQLRIFDENMFKDFVATMFHSKERTEYQDNFNDDEDNKELQEITDVYRTKYYGVTKKAITEIKGISQLHTEIVDVSREEHDEISKETVTVMDEQNEPVDHSFDKEIEKLIANVNLEKIVKEEIMETPMAIKDMNEVIDIKTSNTHKHNKNESVLTLLYLSDDEKRNNIIPVDNVSDEREEVNEGMSIPIDNFEDLTRAKETVVRLIPESELYGLLSDVMGREISNIDVNS